MTKQKDGSLTGYYQKIEYLYSLGFTAIDIAKAIQKPYPYVQAYVKILRDQSSIKPSPLHLLARGIVINELEQPETDEV